MLNWKQITTHQNSIENQDKRKAAIGKANYAESKFWEEMGELKEELAASISLGTMTDNLVNELGDFLFCVLGNPGLAKELQARLDFDVKRMSDRAYKDLKALHEKKTKHWKPFKEAK